MSDKSKLSYCFTRELKTLLEESYMNICNGTTTNSHIVNINEIIVLGETNDVPSCSLAIKVFVENNFHLSLTIMNDLLKIL
jgi:hypothetical protein